MIFNQQPINITSFDLRDRLVTDPIHNGAAETAAVGAGLRAIQRGSG